MEVAPVSRSNRFELLDVSLTQTVDQRDLASTVCVATLAIVVQTHCAVSKNINPFAPASKALKAIPKSVASRLVARQTASALEHIPVSTDNASLFVLPVNADLEPNALESITMRSAIAHQDSVAIPT